MGRSWHDRTVSVYDAVTGPCRGVAQCRHETGVWTGGERFRDAVMDMLPRKRKRLHGVHPLARLGDTEGYQP